MTHDFLAESAIVLIVWLAVLCALVAQHAYWRHLREWKRYVVGTATLCLGCTLVGVALGNPALAIVPWVLASAGSPIVVLYLNEDPRERNARLGQKRATLRGLTEYTTHESDMDEGRSAN